MDTAMRVKIDDLCSSGGSANRGFENGFGLACKGDDTAVMVGVTGPVKHMRASNRGNSGFEGGHPRRVTSFGKVRHALNQQRQTLAFARLRLIRKLPSRSAMAT